MEAIFLTDFAADAARKWISRGEAKKKLPWWNFFSKRVFNLVSGCKP
jgi:hypothetical protein